MHDDGLGENTKRIREWRRRHRIGICAPNQKWYVFLVNCNLAVSHSYRQTHSHTSWHKHRSVQFNWTEFARAIQWCRRRVNDFRCPIVDLNGGNLEWLRMSAAGPCLRQFKISSLLCVCRDLCEVFQFQMRSRWGEWQEIVSPSNENRKCEVKEERETKHTEGKLIMNRSHLMV